MVFKEHFRSIIFYSLPTSIVFIVRKRLNFISFIVLALTFIFFSIL